MAAVGLPSRLLRSSDGLGWTAVAARVYEDPAASEAFTVRSEDLLLVLVTAGRYRIESRHDGTWRQADYRPGSMGVSAPGRDSTLRWRSDGRSPLRSLHLHLDPSLVPDSNRFPDALSVDDPFAAAGARALEQALDERGPALYADSLAQALVAHLAHRSAPSRPPAPTPLAGRDVERVVAYMHDHLAEDVPLADLAAVVSLSKYHFLRGFSAATGLTPHRYLARVRLQAAEGLLRGTRLTVQQVAGACGYRSPARFAAAFRRAYGCSPTAYRGRGR
ncbi:helix-turn-helix domain-containing protein [Vallicoccus soli]|uniref:Helix-turn-helix domain-containing protein n=1 Tax=Vallicoccus soli TaxID=2339232 RepID=A0A3A3Z0M3_9ACTN|nr:helix-turn-helix domain-containing protein [Vallicoccus soli]RJK95946.1 helix-turn-helix domain-containing protein [Vallicoccus soli]